MKNNLKIYKTGEKQQRQSQSNTRTTKVEEQQINSRDGEKRRNSTYTTNRRYPTM